MALATYTDLLNSINGSAGWLHRSDLSAIAPDWVALAEATMNYGDLETLGVSGLRTGDQETTATLTTTANVQTVALPSDFLEMRKVYLNYGGVRVELIEAPVLPIRTDELGNFASVPRSYIVVGSSLYLIPMPSQAWQITIDYYAKIGPLATSNTNWLMTKSPMVYLAGSIVHGAPWLGPKFDPTPYAAMFKGGMKQIEHSDNMKRNNLTTLRSEAAFLSSAPYNILTGT